MLGDWDDLAGEVYDLETEVTALKAKNESLEAEVNDSDKLMGELYEEVAHLQELLRKCYEYARHGHAFRIVTIAKEFADE